MDAMIEKLRVVKDQHLTGKDALSVSDFYATPYMRNDMLTTTLTHLYGDQFGQDLLLHQMTIGKAIYGKDVTGIQKQPVNTMEYEWPIMGRIFRNGVTTYTPYDGADIIGNGGESFFIWFDTNVFDNLYTIESPNEIQIRLISEGVQDINGWRYEAVAQNVPFVPLTEVQGGVEWAQMFSVHSEEDGDEPGFGYRVLPGKAKNQLNVVAAKRSWKANVTNKKLTIQVPTGENKLSYHLLDQDQFFFDLFWMKSKETVMMYGEYNQNTNGTITLRENNNSASPIRVGAGLLEQIPNKATYTQLSYQYLESLIMDIYFSNPETAGKKVTLITGQGGTKEFDRAMKDYANDTVFAFNQTNDKIVKGEGSKLYIDGFFHKAYFIGGYEVEVLHNRLFDYGVRAVKSPKHPVTNLPLESYRMVFLDESADAAESNLTYVYEEGREVMDGLVQGLTNNPKGMPAKGMNIVTPRQVSSYHRIGTCGICFKNPSRSLHLVPSIG